MDTEYYLVDGKQREGPFSLLDMMRKIRGGRIKADSPIAFNQAEEPVAAASVKELRDFFESAAGRVQHRQGVSVESAFASGWRFLTTNQLSSAYAGGMVMLTYLAVQPFFAQGWIAGLLVSYLLYQMLYGLYAACILRISRGQYLTSDFVMDKLLPSVLPILSASALVALASAVGLVLALIPGILLLTLYCFAPFILIDRKCGVIEAMHRSRKMVSGSGSETFGVLLALVSANFLGSTLVILIPLMAPIITNALAEIYDQLAISAPST